MKAPGRTPPRDPCVAFTLMAATFAENTATLSTRASNAIDQLADRLRSISGDIVITGHTDPRPASFPGGNHGLSLARARAVVRALVERRIPESSFTDVVGRAASELVDAGTNAASYRANRRVEVIVYCDREPA